MTVSFKLCRKFVIMIKYIYSTWREDSFGYVYKFSRQNFKRVPRIFLKFFYTPRNYLGLKTSFPVFVALVSHYYNLNFRTPQTSHTSTLVTPPSLFASLNFSRDSLDGGGWKKFSNTCRGRQSKKNNMCPLLCSRNVSWDSEIMPFLILKILRAL